MVIYNPMIFSRPIRPTDFHKAGDIRFVSCEVICEEAEFKPELIRALRYLGGLAVDAFEFIQHILGGDVAAVPDASH